MRWTCFVALFVLNLACGPKEEKPDSNPSWLTGAGPARGHEDITRLAVDRANDVLQGQLGFRPYPSIAKGVAGIDTGNAMIKGNFESDFPSNRMREFHGMPHNIDWHNDGRIQHIHSLRDHFDGQPLGKQAACEAIRSNIVNAARRALDSYREGAVEDGRYWLGHATHVIQDSFSPAHTRREGPGRSFISDICTYGIKVAGICEHDAFDVRDRVWNSEWSCQLNPNKRDRSCLKNEAKDAVDATAVFLIQAGEAIFNGKSLDKSLHGYFACESLPL